MIAKCVRCEREQLICNKKKRLCNSCLVSLNQHKRRVLGLVTEKEREKKKIYFKEYYQKNKEYFLKAVATNREKNKNKNSSRRMTLTYKSHVLSLYEGKCFECGSDANLEIHHLVYIMKSEELNRDTVVVYCRSCHRLKHRLNKKRRID